MIRNLALIACVLLMTGCAATVKKGQEASVALPDDARSNLVVNFQGTDRVLAHPDWGRLKTEWRGAMQSEASTAGYRVTEQAGTPRAEGKPGVLIVIDVSNFRYLTAGTRYAVGIMSGNAWIESKVNYSSLLTGANYGSRTYNTSSTAWEGVFSAMTEEQIQAISKEIVAEVRAAPRAPEQQPAALSKAGSAALSKDQRIKLLQQEKLSYEDYQRRYKEIVGE
ncbi:conserved exported protein of unknown function [Pseudomonas marincola]|uniref:DUF4410 domain-containing protein n=1 Tax=Pseudomonas marincola TaxID=437900 RepID=A0A653E7Y5_9PSED|nr:DUF4410 domain-containing protein [Pseudomonas marincola]CAE6906217.1 conserved exported protein of unknown function [Pseudomonas marincola]